MNTKTLEKGVIFFIMVMIFFSQTTTAGERVFREINTDSISLMIDKRRETSVSSYSADDKIKKYRFIHKVGVETRSGIVLPKVIFNDEDMEMGKSVKKSFSTHLKYSFQSLPTTFTDRIYGGGYQGIGLGYFSLGNKDQLGNPVVLYVFQGGRILRINSKLTLNYEWNFGASFGWQPYDFFDNYYNKTIGSKVNAYLNTNFYFNRTLSDHFDLIAGVSLTHFSNGNTKFPNAGLNTVGLKIGLIYTINREVNPVNTSADQRLVPVFPRHISYDLVFFGSWRKKGVDYGDEQVASPHTYTVGGFNFAPMYNLGYKTRVGISLDGVYDGSANVYTEDYIIGTAQQFYKPPLKQQFGLGLSARAEYVMPYFTVGIGLGRNFINGGGKDWKGYYQVVALKVAITRSTFIHVGYNLKDFHDPNYLMLGIGYRFNNKYPIFRL